LVHKQHWVVNGFLVVGAEYMAKAKPRAFSAVSITMMVALSANLFLGCQFLQPASAQVVRDDQPQAHGQSNLPDVPISVWHDQEVKPNAVAVCVHGLAMHGRVYDRMARVLARQGFVVYAQDLRGYGRWQEKSLRALAGDERLADINEREQSITVSEPTTLADDGSRVAEVSYGQSFEDLKEVIQAARHEYPSLPLFLIGESLGAGLSLHAAEMMPGSVSGLVLSSPALKRRLYIAPEVVKDFSTLVTRPHRQCDLSPYIKKLSSEDPRIVEEELNDPYIRKHMTCADMLKTFSMIKSNLDYARGVSADIPVLVIQGDHDRILKQNAVVLLLDRLKCKDQTVRWLSGKGHVLIETALIEPSTLGTISSWLIDHLPDGNMVQAQNTSEPDKAQSN
jgi:alpha-beta hydrolase superfamily lysophospholipase